MGICTRLVAAQTLRSQFYSLRLFRDIEKDQIRTLGEDSPIWCKDEISWANLVWAWSLWLASQTQRLSLKQINKRTNELKSYNSQPKGTPDWLQEIQYQSLQIQSHGQSSRGKWKKEKWPYSSAGGKWMGGDWANQKTDAQTKAVNRSVNLLISRLEEKALRPRKDRAWVTPGEHTRGWLYWYRVRGSWVGGIMGRWLLTWAQHVLSPLLAPLEA